MVNDHDITVVNHLIEATIDSSDGYRQAADVAGSHSFQELFYARANERDALAQRMQDHVRELGGTPTNVGTFVAGAHRLFMNLHAKVSSNDEAAIVADVESGEDHIKAQFESAVRDPNLSPETRNLIQESQAIILGGHDQMRDLKHGMQGVSGAM